jgi:hypothetical protein
MPVIKFSKWAINFPMGNFFWDDSEDKYRYHLSNWYSLAQRKEFGGMWIPDFRDLTMCLLDSKILPI